MAELVRRPPDVFRKHHPGLLQSDEQVIRQFVVRRRELNTLLELLRGNADAPSCQHALILGPRGRGKSMLLARVAAELRTDSTLASWALPVSFVDESAGVFDAASFWLDALLHLARELEPHESEFARELRATRSDLILGWRADALEARARAAVLEAAERLDRRLVLLIENLHEFSGNAAGDFGWKLRETLQSEPRIIALATATTHFEALDDATAPFFELFRTVSLDPLTAEECRLLWERITGESLSGSDIRPIEILTGGNPRLLVIIGRFAEHASARSLMERLAVLMDDHSEYFRSRIEALPVSERRVFLAAADLWRPSEVREIAARAMMDVRSASVMLGRLRNRGAIAVETEGKKQLYSVAERLFSIYYKLQREQNEAGVVHNLIRYMALLYSGSGSRERFTALVVEARTAPAVREGLARALAEQPDLAGVFRDQDRELLQHLRSRAQEIGESRLDQQLARIAAALATRDIAGAADLVGEMNRRDGALGSAPDSSLSAVGLLVEAMCRELIGETDRMVGTLNTFLDRFERTEKPFLQRYVGMALVSLAERHLKAGDPDAAIATCDRAVKLFGESRTPALRAWVARALNASGFAYSIIGNHNAARTAYDDLLTRFAASREMDLQEEIAVAMVSVGMLMTMAGDSREGARSLQDAVARFRDAPGEKCVFSVGMALMWLSLEFQIQGRTPEAFDAVDRAIARLGALDSRRLRPPLAFAMMRKGDLLVAKADADAAIKMYAEVVERFTAHDSAEMDEHVADALLRQALVHELQDEREAAERLCDEVIERFRGSTVTTVQRHVVNAMLSKARQRLASGSAEEAFALCDDAERIPAADLPLLTWMLQGVRVRGYAKRGLGDRAVEALRRAYEVFDPRSDMMVCEVQGLVPDLVAAGASPVALAKVLGSNRAKAHSLGPLIAALRLQVGESLRVPAEVREVANDVRELMSGKAATPVRQGRSVPPVGASPTGTQVAE
ncbi:MAG: AAA family ATPase [Gemmatimonadetes bacterium]|nr:AAA family ATPase [Acidobacteriota bacterium]MYE68899.1 AAA family ATPase [Gemmatimonadota bacterium]MYJ68025.1 AAA family ATPase [Gemmatimonadota bacterium]